MTLVLSVLAVIWGLGFVMGTPRRPQVVMTGVVLGAVVVVQLTLEAGHPLREATGGDVRLWLLILGIAGLVAVYRRVLRRVRLRATKVATERDAMAPAKPQPAFSDSELTRYARHMMLREIGGPGQKKLKAARVLVVGAGGLGSPVLLYLAAAGVGTIGVIDDDDVDTSNLQRQVIHRDDWVGRPKVHSAAEAMVALNPHISVRPYARRFTEDIAADLLADYDLVLDGCDNFRTRYAVNAACVAAGKPLISAAITQWEGQLSLFDPAHDAPCYACVFPEAPAEGLVPTCAEAGVAGPLPGVVGSMMALEAVKEITGAGQGLRGRLMIYDGLYVDQRVMTVRRRSDCSVCGGTHRLP